MKPLLAAALLCLATLAAGCGDDDSSDEASGAQSSAAAQSPAEAANRSKPQVRVPDGAPPKQLDETDQIEGSGATAKAGDSVTVHYVGVNFKNGKEFDASWSRGEPFTFTLGAGEVIPGWEQGIEGMKAGGRRQLVIPPDLAYGKEGFPPAIGPEETLVFVVDLLDVE
jgi:peptidylprolyl isomerase